MRIDRRLWISLTSTLFLAATALGAAGQPTSKDANPVDSVLGVWALHPIEPGAEPPPPPPVYASYRKNEPPVEKIARVVFEKKDGKLEGKAIFAKGILAGKDGGDVSGQPEIPLREVSYDGKRLLFKATVQGKTFEAEASLQGDRGDRFEGSWKTEDGEGPLFLNKR